VSKKLSKPNTHKQVAFVINVVQQSIHINNVHNNNINLLYAFIVEIKAILPGNVIKIKKVFTEKEALVLGVEVLGIFWRIAQPDKEEGMEGGIIETNIEIS